VYEAASVTAVGASAPVTGSSMPLIFDKSTGAGLVLGNVTLKVSVAPLPAGLLPVAPVTVNAPASTPVKV